MTGKKEYNVMIVFASIWLVGHKFLHRNAIKSFAAEFGNALLRTFQNQFLCSIYPLS